MTGLHRKALRHRLLELLRAGWTAAGSRVSSNASGSPLSGELPALSLYTRRQSSRKVSDSPRILQVVTTFALEGWIELTPGLALDDQLDDLEAQATAVLLADPLVGGLIDGLAQDVVLVDLQMETSDEGGKEQAGFVASYEVTWNYSPVEGDPGDVWRLAFAGVEWDLPPFAPPAEIAAELEFPQG